ncbi:MAG: helix-turn-helix transcriptional regulator [Lachnospiraceae bacterium]|nr:helix-turn-helix transcriptional regulator [Lachnospiraceae bacterium]
MANNIHYLYNAQTGIEMIFCKHSTISYPLHNHVSVLTIGIILDGSVLLNTNQETKIYTQNETFAILPYVPHSILANNSYTLLSLCIDKSLINNVDIMVIQNNIALLLAQALNIEEIKPYQILLILKRLNESTDIFHCNFKKHISHIDDLKKQLELYPERKLTVEEMAQNTFTSKYHFIRSFKTEVGLTPHQFQIQNRIRKAQRLLHETDTITEVALTTGFCEQSHFIKQFKKYVGLSPYTYKSSSRIIQKDASLPFHNTKKI